MGKINVKRKSVINGDVSPKLRILFKMSHSQHAELSLSQIANLTDMPKQLVGYHIPQMVKSGVVMRKEGKYTLQDHFYHANQYMELIMPLIRAIDKSIEGEYENHEQVLLQNVTYFLANLSIEFEDD